MHKGKRERVNDRDIQRDGMFIIAWGSSYWVFVAVSDMRGQSVV